MIGVLFVGARNTARSCLAEAIFRCMVAEVGLSDLIWVDSAGLSRWHIGATAQREIRAILAAYDLPDERHARLFQSADLDQFDYILTMDRFILSTLWNIITSAEDWLPNVIVYGGREIVIRPLLHYAYVEGFVEGVEVPTPTYPEDFEPVYQLIRLGCLTLLDTIRRERELV